MIRNFQAFESASVRAAVRIHQLSTIKRIPFFVDNLGLSPPVLPECDQSGLEIFEARMMD